MRKKIKTRVLINLVVVVLLGVFSGYFAGNYYKNNFLGGVQADLIPSEATLRDDVDKVIVNNAGKSIDKISAVDNFVIAEDKIYDYDKVKKLCLGEITAAGVTQNLMATRIKDGNNYFGEEISCKTGSIGVDYAQRFYYTEGVDAVPLYNGTNITKSSADFPSSPSVNHTYQSFRDVMGISPMHFQNYIISNKTIISQEYLGKTSEGNYKFSLVVDINTAVKNYMYKIKATSGSSEFPTFEKSYIEFEINDNWEFVKITYDEEYKVSIKVIGRVKTVADITETFEYGGDFSIPQI